MAKVLQILLAPRALLPIAIGVVVAAVYVVGLFFAVDPNTLHLVAAGVVIGGLLLVVLKQQQAAKAGAAIEDALRAQGAAHVGGTRPDQQVAIQELRSQFDESLEQLRRSKLGRSALYTIPWYMLIGPPGSGKSTLLRQSGLSFPYMTKGRSAIRGLGGTKNCDWWFADRGILLDTAGRYMVESEDREEWMSFLRMLKRSRSQRPVNGALVAVGIGDLIECSETELQGYADNIRERIDELTRELGAVFPIYVVFTKCDRLRGFVETFDTLNKDQRKQVWGFTWPFVRPAGFELAREFEREFEELYRGLTARRVDLLASDHFKKRRAQLYAFPLQFLRVKERLSQFLAQLEQANPYQEVSPIRGVYFTSGTQEGSTIDKILKVLRPAELEHDVPEDSRRCYFVDDLFTKIVFEDAALATPTQKSRSRAKWMRIGGIAGLAALAVGAIKLEIDAMSGFAKLRDDLHVTYYDRGKSSPEEVMRSLDAQLAILKQQPKQLDRGGLPQALKGRFATNLATVVTSRLSARKQPSEPPPGGDEQRQREWFEKARGNLQFLEGALAAFLWLPSPTAEGPRPGYDFLVGQFPDLTRHLDFLAQDPEFRGKVDSVHELATVWGNDLEPLRNAITAQRRADLEHARKLEWRQILRGAAAMLEQETAFRDVQHSVSAPWSEPVQGLKVKGPVLPQVAMKAKGAMEDFLDQLREDVDAARGLVGITTGEPVASLVGAVEGEGGTPWSTRVDALRESAFSEMDSVFTREWGALLVGVAQYAEEGKDTARSVGELDRLRVVPELVRIHLIAREVLTKREPLTQDRHKALDEGRIKLPPLKDWFDRPTSVEGLKVEQILDAARNSCQDVDDAKAQVPAAYGSLALSAQFARLSNALLESTLTRHQTALKKQFLALRADAKRAFTTLVGKYPFADRESSTVSDLAKGLTAGDEVGAALLALANVRGFELTPEAHKWIADVAQLREEMLEGTSLKVQADIRLQALGGITNPVLTLEERVSTEFRAESKTWRMGNEDQLRLTFGIPDRRPDRGAAATRSATLADLDAKLARAPGRTSLPADLWGLKRFLKAGTMRESSQPGTLTFEFGVSGMTKADVVLVMLSRMAPARIFRDSWPEPGQYAWPDPIWVRQ